jgi:hypothetical protein
VAVASHVCTVLCQPLGTGIGALSRLIESPPQGAQDPLPFKLAPLVRKKLASRSSSVDVWRRAARRPERAADAGQRLPSVFTFVFTGGCRRLMLPLGRGIELRQQIEPPVPAVGAALLRPSRDSTDTDTARELCSALTILFRFPCARGDRRLTRR